MLPKARRKMKVGGYRRQDEYDRHFTLKKSYCVDYGINNKNIYKGWTYVPYTALAWRRQ